jgi:hypothetical protein
VVTFRELNDLRLGKLKAAVTDWEQMAAKLARLASGEGDVSAAGLEKKAQSADWKGNNATVTKEFVTTTAGEFDDAVTAARSIHTILSGAHTKFAKHKADLRTAVDNAAKKNIYVSSEGTVSSSVPPPHVAGDADIEPPTQAQLDAVADEIKVILRAAAATDRTTAAALRFHAQDKYDFRSEGFTSFDGAQQAIEDSDAVVKLASMDPSKMTNEQLERFNRLMARNSNDPVFAERVATGLGPEKTLQFFARAVDLERWTPGDGEDREKRKELLGTLEEQLGTTLGTATHSGSDAMAAWKERVIALGPDEVSKVPEHASGPAHISGFQAMSNLMRHGEYERDFLGDYGDALVAYEKEHTGDVTDPGPRQNKRENVLPWDAMPSYSKVDQLHFGGSDTDAGVDPMTGFMKALSNNPDASTDFFSASDPQDNSQWVLKDRPVFNDIVPDSQGYGESAEDYDGPNAVLEATGDALFAGASGMDPGDESAKAGEHTPEQREVYERAVGHLADRGDGFPSEMREDMAKVLVNHGETTHETMSDVDGRTPVDRADLLEVSQQISRDQDAYGTLSQGMNYAMAEDIQTEKAHPEDSLDRVGRTVGFLEEARYQAIGDRAGDELSEVGWDKNKIYHGVGAVANFVPGVGDIAQRGVDMLATGWMENEQGRIKEAETDDNQSTYDRRTEHLVSLADLWYEHNSAWADGETGYSKGHGVYSQIEASANDGNDKAKGLAGDQ